MVSLSGPTGLYTDLYEIAMACGYFLEKRHHETAVFDYFFRTNPFEGGYTVFAGLRDFLEMLVDFRFSSNDLDYLDNLGYQHEFLHYLGSFHFQGNIDSVEEGEIVFPQEPLVRVEGTLVEAQLIESMLLNVLNFESLVATKACRIRQAAGNRPVAEFGLRRAQGWGALQASRASCIGGADSTSNVMAARKYGIPPSGTLAHSWIQSFGSELEAFRNYAAIYGNKTILLVDTYDTLRSGIPNAITVAREMEQAGKKLKGIRLDSGDLACISKKAREMLDEAGLSYVMIVASNQLNEYLIQSLLGEQEAPIDAFGVGTELVSAKPDAALDGVYKLAVIGGAPRMKISENPEKTTLPGKKELVRFFNAKGFFMCDGILLSDDRPGELRSVVDPVHPEKRTSVRNLPYEYLLKPAVLKGNVLTGEKSPYEIREYLQYRIAHLPGEHLRFVNPHLFRVGISRNLLNLRNNLIKNTHRYE